MFKKLKKLVDLIFVDDVVESLVKLLPWIFLLVGSLCLAIGVYFDLSFFTSVGTTVLAAGVFSSLLKTYQFKRVFADELQKIIYTEEYFGKPKDPGVAWRALARSVFSRRFPDWPDAATDLVVKRYLPSEVQHYYRNMERVATLSIDPDLPEILSLKDEVSFEYYPATDNFAPEYEFYFTTLKYDLPNKKFQDDVKVLVDGFDMKDKLQIGEAEQSKVAGKDVLTFRCTLALPELQHTANHYKIVRKSVRHHNFIIDPFSRVFSDTFIEGYSLTIHGLDKLEKEQRFSLRFIDAGVKEKFKNDLGNGAIPKTAQGGHFWHTPELIFPSSGYILTYRRLEAAQ